MSDELFDSQFPRDADPEEQLAWIRANDPDYVAVHQRFKHQLREENIDLGIVGNISNDPELYMKGYLATRDAFFRTPAPEDIVRRSRAGDTDAAVSLAQYLGLGDLEYDGPGK
jgi:hypothetical protein